LTRIHLVNYPALYVEDLSTSDLPFVWVKDRKDRDVYSSFYIENAKKEDYDNPKYIGVAKMLLTKKLKRDA
jgi:hypothetical protein